MRKSGEEWKRRRKVHNNNYKNTRKGKIYNFQIPGETRTGDGQRGRIRTSEPARRRWDRVHAGCVPEKRNPINKTINTKGPSSDSSTREDYRRSDVLKIPDSKSYISLYLRRVEHQLRSGDIPSIFLIATPLNWWADEFRCILINGVRAHSRCSATNATRECECRACNWNCNSLYRTNVKGLFKLDLTMMLRLATSLAPA